MFLMNSLAVTVDAFLIDMREQLNLTLSRNIRIDTFAIQMVESGKILSSFYSVVTSI